jgi:hypothetical protein
MNSLDKLREQKKAYIKEQADKIILGMERRKVTTDTLATCDYSNWDKELHRNMNDISTELCARGFSVSSRVNHGVTDWVISINI